MSGQSEGSGATGEGPQALPDFEVAQFDLTDAPECDMVMKGGVTSGIVYPYAILQIATQFRLRSLGGTSAGAIAAAFAAAAEYGRQTERPEAFLVLKNYCDELPERLLSLFQPTPDLEPAVQSVKAAMASGGVGPLLRRGLSNAALPTLAGSAAAGGAAWLAQPSVLATGLAATLGAVIAGGFGFYRWARTTFAEPFAAAIRDLPTNNFGFCTGLTQGDNDPLVTPGLTDWIHRALQHIAFGDPDHPVPLTFGHLEGDDPTSRMIDLQVVTTNLSMRRPHTLPRLGLPAGFRREEWDRLFPEEVMDWLCGEGTKRWQRHAGSWRFPSPGNLPVVIAVRMSLSFPVLFTAVPLIVEDKELPAIARTLGGGKDRTIPPQFRKVHLSDGGISSNFPIHMFDVWLPSRPTFAFSLEDLAWDPADLDERVAIAQAASEGMGVQIKEMRSLPDLGWQVLNSAKDWQDQLLSELSGQRERIARIFLTGKEGGLNLDMSPEVSRDLMLWGYQAGRKFTDGGFDFDEHRWRRLLVIYKHLEQNLEDVERIWPEFEAWYRGYLREVKSYREVTLAERAQIAGTMGALVAARSADKERRVAPGHLPQRAGVLKVAPRY